MARPTTASFTCDGVGRCTSTTVGGTTTGHVNDGANLVQELSGGTPSANMLMRLGIDGAFSRTDSSGTSGFMTDALGSTLALADSSGGVQTSYTYDPFGNPSSTGATSSNTQQYTGRENDGTGLQYNRARYYSATLQRFISEDPAGFGGGDVNLYAYAGNDPFNASDPSGQFIIGVIAVVCLLGCDVGAYYGWTHSRKDRWTYAAGDALVGYAAGAYAGAAIAVAAVAAAAGAGGAAVAAATTTGAAAAVEAGGADEAASAADEGARGLAALRDALQAMGDRTFSRFLSSLQTQAAQAGQATRDVQETQQILDEALRRGYTLVRLGEEDWVGGPHGHLIGPQGQTFHFPFPPGFHP